MVSQKTISVKLDIDQLDLLDKLCSELGCNRNKMINFAVKMFNSNFEFFSSMLFNCCLPEGFIEIK